MCAFDFVLLIAFVVVAVTLGKPISYLNCFEIARVGDGAAATAAWVQSVRENLGVNGKLVGWVGATKMNCFETKGAWGLSIALW